jgi:hypothetical protein
MGNTLAMLAGHVGPGAMCLAYRTLGVGVALR